MALINCPECGKEISNKASACMHCGYPLDNGINILEDVPYLRLLTYTMNQKDCLKFVDGTIAFWSQNKEEVFDEFQVPYIIKENKICTNRYNYIIDGDFIYTEAFDCEGYIPNAMYFNATLEGCHGDRFQFNDDATFVYELNNKNYSGRYERNNNVIKMMFDVDYIRYYLIHDNKLNADSYISQMGIKNWVKTFSNNKEKKVFSSVDSYSELKANSEDRFHRLQFAGNKVFNFQMENGMEVDVDEYPCYIENGILVAGYKLIMWKDYLYSKEGTENIHFTGHIKETEPFFDALLETRSWKYAFYNNGILRLSRVDDLENCLDGSYERKDDIIKCVVGTITRFLLIRNGVIVSDFFFVLDETAEKIEKSFLIHAQRDGNGKKIIPQIRIVEVPAENAPWDTEYYDFPCPYCGIYKVRPAKWADKEYSAAFWGVWSHKLHARYKCDKCKKMWE